MKENEIQDIVIYNKNLVHGKLTKQYPDIKGDFDCSDIHLISLEFVPQHVGRYFSCSSTNITSLEFAPQSVGGNSVGGNFYCSGTNITSLEFAPQYVGSNFACFNTKITSLEFVPQHVGRNFYCYKTDITSLEFAPQSVGGNFSCSGTNITSLKGIGKDYLKEVKGYIILNDCHELKSNMLCLLLVKGLQTIFFDTNYEVQYIFNRHLIGERDILDCQEELITKGFKEYAKL